MSKQITGEASKKIVKENLVAADDKRTVCADGRYEKEQSRAEKGFWSRSWNVNGNCHGFKR